jgi:uncharacterized membrane protein
VIHKNILHWLKHKFVSTLSGCILSWKKTLMVLISVVLFVQIMAKKRGLSWEKVSSLADLQSAVRASLVEMVDLVKNLLHEQPYSKEEVR